MDQNCGRMPISEDDYHADRLPEWVGGGVPTLSNSIAKVLLDKSPAHAHAMHPRFGRQRVESAVFDAGHLAHKLLLGAGAEVAVIDASDYKSKAAQQARDEARAHGQIPALTAAYQAAVKANDVIAEKLAQRGIELRGESEVKLAWREPGRSFWCRGMLDHITTIDGRRTIVDLKTTRDAKPSAISNSVVRYGYDTQRAAYTRAYAMLDKSVRERDIDFIFIFAETAPPYAVTVGRLDDVLRERGEERWGIALDKWSECLATDQWPEYATGLIDIAAPPWMSGDIEIGFEED